MPPGTSGVPFFGHGPRSVHLTQAAEAEKTMSYSNFSELREQLARRATAN
jgi:hypothetical protein